MNSATIDTLKQPHAMTGPEADLTYRIVAAASAEQLTEFVNVWMRLGWVPHGTHVVTVVKLTHKDGGAEWTELDWTWSQAMVKED